MRFPLTAQNRNLPHSNALRIGDAEPLVQNPLNVDV
jgi:hypothetical protein